MRNFLNSISVGTLLKIAADQGKQTKKVEEAVAFIIEQAKTYGWSVKDLKNRYQI